MDALVEPRVRRVVAEVLGIDDTLLAAEVSLNDDLAADSLDLVELCMALEDAFALSLPHGLPDWVRTYAQLVHFVDAVRPTHPPFVVVTIVPASGAHAQTLARTSWLTPYDVETICDDALRLGAGTTLDVCVGEADDVMLGRIRAMFSRVTRHDIRLSVHRVGETGARTHAA